MLMILIGTNVDDTYGKLMMKKSFFWWSQLPLKCRQEAGINIFIISFCHRWIKILLFFLFIIHARVFGLVGKEFNASSYRGFYSAVVLFLKFLFKPLYVTKYGGIATIKL